MHHTPDCTKDIQNSPIKRVLFNEISFVIAMIGAISSAIIWISNPQKVLEIEIVKLQSRIESTEVITSKLEQIKNNDLHEIQIKLDRMDERQLEIIKAIARLEAKIK